MTGKAAGSKKRAGAASSAPSKKSKINDRKKETKKTEEEVEEEEEQTPEAGKNPRGKKSEASSPLLVFAHGAGANSSHEWMVRYVHSYPHVNFLELESFRS